MPNGLSYPSLTCVLEHFEANKRIRVAARCPNLRRIEKKIPLHLNFLKYGDSEITVNDITYIFLPSYSAHLQLNYVCKKSRIKYEKRLTKNLENHVAIKKLTCFLLGERRDVRVKELNINVHRQPIQRLTEGIKFRVRKLDNLYEPFDVLSKIIHESSYPLKKFETFVSQLPSFEHPLIKTSEELEFRCLNGAALAVWLDVLLKLQNKKVRLSNNELSMEDYITIIQNWLNNGREIGTLYIFTFYNKTLIMELLHKVQTRFKGVAGKFNEDEELHVGGSFRNLQSVTIPMSSVSELCIYVRRCRYNSNSCEVNIEVRAIGSPTPVEQVICDTRPIELQPFKHIKVKADVPMTMPAQSIFVFIFVVLSIFIFWVINK